MTDRRTYLASVGTALMAATAGCGFILGSEPARFNASPSAVSEAALQETGYEHQTTKEMEVEREFSAGGETRTVVATNQLAKYEKRLDMEVLDGQRVAVFTALTTPQVEVLGETFNPVKDMSAKELAKMVQDRYEQFKNVKQRNESEVSINGQSTTHATFTGDAAFEGSPVELTLHVTEAVELGSDFLVTFGSYPRALERESENIVTLMKAVEQA